MKKKYIIILIIVPLIIAIIYMLIHNQEKFYLNDKYYNNSSFIEIDSNKIQRLNNENYLLFTYNNYCTLPIPCEYIFEDFMKKYNISIISIPFKEFKKTKYYKKVKYAPTVIIIKKGRIISYLDANSEKDLDKYQSINDFEKWISKYIYLNKIN
ncbi:MAG: hypothetical protein IJI49_03675 [Bacilli bacterium]|nr:hypothetical protein [Bacilli bacterium]